MRNMSNTSTRARPGKKADDLSDMNSNVELLECPTCFFEGVYTHTVHDMG